MLVWIELILLVMFWKVVWVLLLRWLMELCMFLVVEVVLFICDFMDMICELMFFLRVVIFLLEVLSLNSVMMVSRSVRVLVIIFVRGRKLLFL